MKANVSCTFRFSWVVLLFLFVSGRALAQTVPSWFFNPIGDETVGVSLPNLSDPQLRQDQAVSQALIQWCLRHLAQHPEPKAISSTYQDAESGIISEKALSSLLLKSQHTLSYRILDRYINENGEEFVRLHIDEQGSDAKVTMLLMYESYFETISTGTTSHFSFRDEVATSLSVASESRRSFIISTYFKEYDSTPPAFLLEYNDGKTEQQELNYDFKEEGQWNYTLSPSDNRGTLDYPLGQEPLSVVVYNVICSSMVQYSSMPQFKQEDGTVVLLIPEIQGIGEEVIEEVIGEVIPEVNGKVPHRFLTLQYGLVPCFPKARNEEQIRRQLEQGSASFDAEAFKKALEGALQ